MGSDESHFNVSVGSDGQSHRTVSTNHNLFEEKGDPKRYRTEGLTARPNRLTRPRDSGEVQNTLPFGSTRADRGLRSWGVEGGYGGGGRGRLYTYRYTVTTRMIPALRWAAMRAGLMFQQEVMDKVTRQCPQTTTFSKRKENRSGFDPRSFRLPA